MNKKIFLALFAIFCFGYILRVFFLPQMALTFGYDQARDAIQSQKIFHGDLKIQGPPASTPGLYHGVFYYYFLAPAYFVGHGSPIIAAYWTALWNALVILVVFYLAYLMTKKVQAGLFSAFIFAISFEATQYATWLSNPTIGIWTVPLLYLGLWVWTKESKKLWWGPWLAGLALGLSIQAEVFLAYHLPPFLIWLWLNRKNIKKEDLGKSLLAFLLGISTMLISEVKFGFPALSGISSLLSGQDAIVQSKGLGDFFILFLNQIGRVYSFSTYPGNVGYGAAFVLILIVMAVYKRKKAEISWQIFLPLWLLSHITVVTVGGVSTPFLLVGIAPAVSLLVGIFLYNWWSAGNRLIVLFILLIITYGNLTMIFKQNFRGSTIFAIQKDMVLKKQLPAIDYTYNNSSGAMFSVNSLTSPLWINIVWTYLYKWYGLPKYGYVPQWHGRDQVGQLDSLPKDSGGTNQYFLILEPMGGIPQRYLGDTIAEENGISKLIQERNFGELIIQKRQKIGNGGSTRQ